MSYYDPNRPKPYTVLDSDTASLDVRQQPQQALVTSEHKEKTRKAIDPPPIVQLKVRDVQHADSGTWLVNPFLFMNVQLVEPEPVNGKYKPVGGSNLLGSTVSSLHRLKDVNNKDGGFFVFGDISCRRLGVFRLQFNLFDIEKNHKNAVFVTSKVSDPFQVVTSKDFRGQMESTHLSRTFSDQGVRLRLRKEQRTISGSKRSFGSSPNPSSTSSMSYNMQTGSLHDRSYGFNAPKRQRSDSEYTPQMYHTPQLASNAMFQYGGRALASQSQPSLTTSQGDSYGGLLSHNNTPSTSIPHWQRQVQQEPMSAPVGGLGPYSYFGALNPATPVQRDYSTHSHTQYQSQQYPSRATEDQHTALDGFQVQSSIPDTATASQQHQIYSHPNADLHSQAGNINIGPANYQMQYPQNPTSTQSNYGFRTPMTNSTVPTYDTRFQPASSGVSYDQQLPTRTAGQYGQGHFENPPDLFSEGSRETFSPNTENVSDTTLSLGSTVLNRSFVPSYAPQPQDLVDQATHDFKDEPNSATTLADSHAQGPDRRDSSRGLRAPAPNPQADSDAQDFYPQDPYSQDPYPEDLYPQDS